MWRKIIPRGEGGAVVVCVWSCAVLCIEWMFSLLRGERRLEE
jgi:hypothetical protein